MCGPLLFLKQEVRFKCAVSPRAPAEIRLKPCFLLPAARRLSSRVKPPRARRLLLLWIMLCTLSLCIAGPIATGRERAQHGLRDGTTCNYSAIK